MAVIGMANQTNRFAVVFALSRPLSPDLSEYDHSWTSSRSSPTLPTPKHLWHAQPQRMRTVGLSGSCASDCTTGKSLLDRDRPNSRAGGPVGVCGTLPAIRLGKPLPGTAGSRSMSPRVSAASVALPG